MNRAKKLIIIAHRGASGYEPENTLRACARALDMGADIIELDVHACKSGEIVVIHDETIDRTTNGTGKVKDLTYPELKKYQTIPGESIPLLSEVFDLVNKRAIINIEMKNADVLDGVQKLIETYVSEKNWSYDHFLVSSYDHHAILTLHKRNPKIPLGVIFEGNPIGYADIAQKAHASYVIVYYGLLTPEFIADAHEKNIQVFVYLVDSKELAYELERKKVDGIMTNYPDIMD